MFHVEHSPIATHHGVHQRGRRNNQCKLLLLNTATATLSTA